MARISTVCAGLVFAALAAGCAVEATEAPPSDPGPSSSNTPGGKGDDLGACLSPRAEHISPPDDLVALSDIPLPSLGPTSDGWFHPSSHYSEGGTFVVADVRPEWSVPDSEIAPAAPPGTLRVVEWNVARGNELVKLIQIMRRTNADVWILNETDFYGQNSGGVVVAREMARALGYSYYTTSEFYEKRDDRRGMSGNAILSRLPMYGSQRMTTPLFLSDGGYDWATSSSEPRCGQRSALSARIDVPAADGGTRSLNIVSLHTENKANAKVRRMQFDAVVKELVTPGEASIIAGDLNTISPFEGGNFRKYLEERWNQLGPVAGQFDCSRGDNTDTFVTAAFVRMRLDWMLLQPGSESGPSCPAGSYQVLDAKGASDHRPVRTEMVIP